MIDAKCSCQKYRTIMSYKFEIKIKPQAVADPWFPRREMGAPTSEFGAKTYYLAKFLLKTPWIWKKFDREGEHLAPHLDPPMISCFS